MATGPLLYRPPPRWQVWAYGGAAAGLHLIAVVAAGIKHEEPPVDLSAIPDAVVIAVEETQPAPPEPTPPPEEIPPPPPPPMPMEQPEFVEEQPTPPPKNVPKPTKPVAPIAAPKPSGPAGPVSISGAKAFMLGKPKIEYPYEARKSRLTGSGVAVMTVDPGSGSVTDVSIAQSTGSPILDNAMQAGLRRARFKPGSVTRVKTPVTFTMTGASY